MLAPASSTVQTPLDQHRPFHQPAGTPTPHLEKSQAAPFVASSTYAPDDLPVPDSPSTPPAAVTPPRNSSLIEQHNEAAHAIQQLYKEQPNFKTFLQQQLATLFPDQPHLNVADLTFKRWRKQNDGSIKTLSVEPFLDALHKEIQEQLRNPGNKAGEGNNLYGDFFTRGSTGVPPTLVTPSHSLHTIAQRIVQYATTQQKFWTTPRQSPHNPHVRTAPQNELLALYKQQLATVAAARANDGTLSPASKQLIDTALQYPTLAARENAFADGARPGVYPLTVDDGTERGNSASGVDGVWQTPADAKKYKRGTPTRDDVLAAAQQHGIKIVGLEHEHMTMHITRTPIGEAGNAAHTTDRLREFNYFASKIIQQTPPGEKWIAVVGRRHMNTTQGVPGIAEQTGAVSVGVYDAPQGASSNAVKNTGSRPAPEEKFAADATVGDYQVHQNVDPYLKTS